MAFFNFFKKGNANPGFSFDKKFLLSLLSQNDNFFYFDDVNECFSFICDDEIREYFVENDNHIKIKSYLFSFLEEPKQNTKGGKYIVRIFSDENAKIHVIYNLINKIGYYIILEKDLNESYNEDVYGNLEIDINWVLEGKHPATDLVKRDDNLLYFCIK
jgi:sporulation protein YlmC with PRC-barrel domain